MGYCDVFLDDWREMIALATGNNLQPDRAVSLRK